MLFYLVQHAEAKREEEDPARGLTEKGLQDIRKVAAFAADLNIRVSLIFHSGKKRALQTAQVLADHLKPERGITQTDGLAPMDDPQIWFENLLRKDEDTMLVGHLPHLARLVAMLLCGDKEKNAVNFKMGGIVCLKRFEKVKWAIEWMIIPEVIK
ncbi:MAG: phosphohistidine phosphatase SixA [Nitrospirota bacterium]